MDDGMEDVERPAAEKPTLGRVPQACQRCRSLKTRCLPSERAGTCQRCLASKRDCIWAEIPRRPRRVRGPSRISQIEQKIDGLVAGLGNAEVSPKASVPAPDGSRRTSTPHVPPRTERPLAPGSWVPFPSSFEQQPTGSEPISGTTQEDEEPTREFLEKLHDIHNFGDADAPSGPPNITFDGPHSTGHGIEHDKVQGLITSGEADALLDVYRTMCNSSPFVPLAGTASARDLDATKPMLLLAILTVADWKNHRRQMSLDEIYRKELAHRSIIRPRKTLSLLQSILVYLSMYHFVFSHKTQQLYTLLQLAVGMALDMGLHQRSKRSLVGFPGRPSPPMPSPEDQRERQRTFLGCYYLSSMVAGGLQKPNLLRYTDYMAECSHDLHLAMEYPSDAITGHLISLSRFDDQIHDSFFSEENVELPITDPRIMMNFRFTESQLEQKKRESCSEEFQRVIDLSSAFTDMQLHSIALRPQNPLMASVTADPTRLNALLATLEACKRYLDTVITIPVSEYHLISFVEWMRLPSMIITLARLCIPNEALAESEWDVKMAHDRGRLDLYLDSLCYRMQSLSTHNKLDGSPVDFWYAMRMIMELTRTWFVRKINPQSSKSASTTSTLPTPDTMHSSGDGSTDEYPLTDPGRGAFGMNIMLGGLDMGGQSHSNFEGSFSFLKDPNFDMGKFFDVGLWDDEAYLGMGFGGGMQF